jgi:dephospho-CoA kinase
MVIGITGGVATGKSTVTEMFRELGAKTLSADDVAREVLSVGSPGLAEVVREFGKGVVAPDGALDRQALADIVFSDPLALGKINDITHPGIIGIIEERISEFRRQSRPGDVLVVEIPLLIECNMMGIVDKVVVVSAEQDQQQNRLTRRGLSIDEARQRIAAQLPLGSKLPFADWIISTDTSLEETHKEVEEVWRAL